MQRVRAYICPSELGQERETPNSIVAPPEWLVCPNLGVVRLDWHVHHGAPVVLLSFRKSWHRCEDAFGEWADGGIGRIEFEGARGPLPVRRQWGTIGIQYVGDRREASTRPRATSCPGRHSKLFGRAKNAQGKGWRRGNVRRARNMSDSPLWLLGPGFWSMQHVSVRRDRPYGVKCDGRHRNDHAQSPSSGGPSRKSRGKHGRTWVQVTQTGRMLVELEARIWDLVGCW